MVLSTKLQIALLKLGNKVWHQCKALTLPITNGTYSPFRNTNHNWKDLTILTGKICHKLANYKHISYASYNLVGYYDNLNDFIDEVLLVQELGLNSSISDNIVIKIAKKTWQEYRGFYE